MGQAESDVESVCGKAATVGRINSRLHRKQSDNCPQPREGWCGAVSVYSSSRLEDDPGGRCVLRRPVGEIGDARGGARLF